MFYFPLSAVRTEFLNALERNVNLFDVVGKTRKLYATFKLALNAILTIYLALQYIPLRKFVLDRPVFPGFNVVKLRSHIQLLQS